MTLQIECTHYIMMLLSLPKVKRQHALISAFLETSGVVYSRRGIIAICNVNDPPLFSCLQAPNQAKTLNLKVINY